MRNRWKWTLVAALVVVLFVTLQWLARRWPHHYLEGAGSYIEVR